MTAMSVEVRKRVVDIASNAGFSIVLKSDGTDEFVKNLMFRMPGRPSFLFIRKEGITTNSNGVPRYFQVAVHPDEFRADCLDPSHGIDEQVNRRTKQNLFASSNYRGFPSFPGYKEPCGKCYKVESLIALERLLSNLASD
jgi:hypothetical protein